MNHKEATLKWYNKKYAETSELGYQCVAWVKKYCYDRGFPIFSFGGSAINGWVTGKPFDSKWSKVIYNGFNSPSEGDIIFWSEGRCKDGHVAVANRFSNIFILRYSDQNGGGNEEAIQPRFSNYKNVLGWYTLKK